MARTMNQTLAWMSAVVLSLVLFGVGFGLFKVMVKGENSHTAAPGLTSQSDSGHAVKNEHEPKEEHGSGHGSSPSDSSHQTDGHASKDSHSEASGKKPIPEEPASTTAEGHEKKDSHGEDEGEISADQFKSKEKGHHD